MDLRTTTHHRLLSVVVCRFMLQLRCVHLPGDDDDTRAVSAVLFLPAGDLGALDVGLEAEDGGDVFMLSSDLAGYSPPLAMSRTCSAGGGV